MNDEELSNQIKRDAERHPASARLRAAVQTQITLHAAQRKPHFLERFKWRELLTVLSRPNGTAQLGLGFVGGVLLTLALVWMVPRIPMSGAQPEAVVADLLTLHVQSMGAGPLFQVASSDRHTVKPWFQGKLDYAPEVPDLHDAGFELLGGRIDKVRGHDTAALAYQLRKHIISAYVMPMGVAVPAQRLQQRGFNIVRWTDGVMQIWALTDADASELERFETAWRSKYAAASYPEK
jgi:anti-sigma factor RsiW